jgi:hypothetical protein
MKFSVGQVLATALGTFARRYGQLFLLVVFGYALIVAFWLVISLGPFNSFVGDLLERLRRIHPSLDYEVISLGWIPISIMGAAIAVYVVGRMRDEPVPFWRALGRALRRIHVIVAVAFVIRLSTTGVVTLVEYLRWNNEYWSTRHAPWNVALNIGLWVVAAALLVAAIPVAAVERRGVFGSLARAWQVTRGERIKVIAIVLAFSIVSTILYYALFQFMVARSDRLGDDFMVYAWVRFGVEVVLAAFYPVLVAVTYEKLRVAKEGPSENQLQRVFS